MPTDYRDTVFLPRTEFPMRGSLAQKEPELLARWKAMDLYGQLRKRAQGREKFILHDGPPYANGNIHIGHALNKILKDVVVRSAQMRGMDAPYVPGWDCHGLPIEWKIEEQYRAEGKNKDQVPVLQFRAECRAFAEKWKNIQSEEFQRLGVLGDWAHPYSTMTKKAEAQIVREIHKFLQNGLLYKGVKPVMWSVVEKTALAEAEIEYQDHTSTTLWVKFPVQEKNGIPASAGMTPLMGTDGAKNTVIPAEAGIPFSFPNNTSIVIWTTTPWTLPANRAIAYGDFDYALVSVAEVAEGSLAQVGEKLVIAEALLATFAADTKVIRFEKLATLKLESLAGTVCHHPLHGKPAHQGYFDYDVPLYHGEFVTTEAGTGFVHIAPGHGEDDFNLGKQYKIKFDETVGDDGRYLPNVKGFESLAVYKPDGKTGEANGAVIKALLDANALLAKKNIKHSYPHSWRSKAPLIFRTTPQWFIAMDDKAGQETTLREKALTAIGETTWYPAIGENRISGMIETRPDWCISRQRAWGVPIALFVHKITGDVLKDKAVLDRIAAAFDAEGADAWYSRPAQEFLGDTYKADDYHQIFDIVDVWFESGATHAFVLNAGEWPDLKYPATLYLEGSDQHRGWFHSSLLESCGTNGRAPYDKILTHGFTLDEQGRKMSKSLGNVVAPQSVIDQMGADILRLWVVASDYSQDLRIGKDILKQTGDLYRRFRNTLRYLLGALDGMTDAERLPYDQLQEPEKWVLHRLSELDAEMRKDIDAFDFNRVTTALHDFCNADLSAFYFDMRKDALYCDAADSTARRGTRTVMEQIFNHLTIWLAPILCFTAEEAYLARHGEQAESVHLQTFPTIPTSWCNAALAEKWAQLRKLRRVATGAMEKARNEKKIGASLEAHPVVTMTTTHAALLDGTDFAAFCICSSCTLKIEPVPPEAFTLPDVPDFGVVVELATNKGGKKCERCWQVLDEVGTHADHPDLCTRCHDAVTAPKTAP